VSKKESEKDRTNSLPERGRERERKRVSENACSVCERVFVRERERCSV